MVGKHKNGAAGNFWYAKENPKVLPLSEKVQVLDLKKKIPYDEVAQVYGKNVFSSHQITFITVYNCFKSCLSLTEPFLWIELWGLVLSVFISLSFISCSLCWQEYCPKTWRKIKFYMWKRISGRGGKT